VVQSEIRVDSKRVFKNDFRLNVVGRIGVGGGKRYEIWVLSN